MFGGLFRSMIRECRRVAPLGGSELASQTSRLSAGSLSETSQGDALLMRRPDC